MKYKILKLAFLLPVLLFFVISCEYKIKEYDGESGIYFDIKTNDSINFTWVATHSDIVEMAFPIKVMTMGRPTNYDRPFEFEIVNERDEIEQAMPNVDYLPFDLNGVIPANESSVDLVITLKRNPDYLLKKAKKVLTIHLKENEHFKFIFDRYNEAERPIKEGDTIKYVRHRDIHRSIIMNELVDRQIWWPKPTAEHSYLGVWSAKKSVFLCDYYKLDRTVWLSGNFDRVITEAYVRFMGTDMARYLDSEAAAGRTIYEEDNVTPMRMGPKSYN